MGKTGAHSRVILGEDCWRFQLPTSTKDATICHYPVVEWLHGIICSHTLLGQVSHKVSAS